MSEQKFAAQATNLLRQECDYKKRVRTKALKEFLFDRYEVDESLVEPDKKTNAYLISQAKDLLIEFRRANDDISVGY